MLVARTAAKYQKSERCGSVAFGLQRGETARWMHEQTFESRLNASMCPESMRLACASSLGGVCHAVKGREALVDLQAVHGVATAVPIVRNFRILCGWSSHLRRDTGGRLWSSSALIRVPHQGAVISDRARRPCYVGGRRPPSACVGDAGASHKCHCGTHQLSPSTSSPGSTSSPRARRMIVVSRGSRRPRS